MRHLRFLQIPLLALFIGASSGCLIVVDDDSDWSGPSVSCSYVCDDYGCWEVCYDQVTCDSNDQCDWGLYCELSYDSYYYGQCVTSPAGTCTTQDDCDADGYVCDERDTCVPGEAPPPPPPPTCEAHLTEADCVAAADCAPVYAGINCTTPGGDVCSNETPDCTCESFAFSRCEPFVTP